MEASGGWEHERMYTKSKNLQKHVCCDIDYM